jgi:outer membrane receptor for ferrienterochelin and colicins
MLTKTIIYNFLFILILSTHLLSQVTVKGVLLDQDDEAVAGANIYIEGTVLGAATNEDGHFLINKVPNGSYSLVISFVGFQQQTISLQVEDNDIDLKNIKLQPLPFQSQPIVTTASKHSQNFQDVPASVANVDALQISNRNAITIADVLQYTSGINLTEDQINIRGSSGYSRGVGSRVLMLVDGVPYIAGDTQGLVFEALTINEIESIEIVKGSGSALYGSGAMGGVINIITKPIREKSDIYFKLYGGIYDNPYYKEWQWSDRSRFLNGIKAGYSKKTGGFGFRFAAARDEDDSYRQNDWKKRINFSGKIQYDFSPFDRLTINGNYMDQRRGNFLYWKNLKNALIPAEGQEHEGVQAKRYFLNSEYRKVLDENDIFKANVLWFHNYFKDNVGGSHHNSTSDYLYGEIQYSKTWGEHLLTVGISPSTSSVSSDSLFGKHEASGFATYFQDETEFFENFSAIAGLRFDYSNITDAGTDQQISPRLGLVWKVLSGGAFRFSAGTGFRAPSIAELFTSTTAAGFPVIPNPDLKAEKSTSFEIGWNQIFSTYFATDLALFNNDYNDLIEGQVLNSGTIQFNNITKARIRGLELNIFGQASSKKFHYSLGYTYTDARDTDHDVYLTFRPRNLFYLSLNGKISLLDVGIDYRFIQRYDRIDEAFAQVINDSNERINAHIVDLRVSNTTTVGSTPVTSSLQINNLFQYNYVDLIGSIAPIRHFILSLETSF